MGWDCYGVCLYKEKESEDCSYEVTTALEKEGVLLSIDAPGAFVCATI